jgi:hypothetical protein
VLPALCDRLAGAIAMGRDECPKAGPGAARMRTRFVIIGGWAVDRPLLRYLRDPVEQRLLREGLEEQAKDDSDPLARDMARDVLAGNTTLYQAIESSVYGELFAQRVQEYVTWWNELPESERERLYAEGREQMARARAEDR